MSEPQEPPRLLDATDGEEPLLRDALRAARDELPAAADLERLWSRLPLGPTGGPASGGDGGGAGPDGGPPAGGPGGSGGPSGAGPAVGPGLLPVSAATIKLVTGAIVAATAVGVAVHYGRGPAPPDTAATETTAVTPSDTTTPLAPTTAVRVAASGSASASTATEQEEHAAAGGHRGATPWPPAQGTVGTDGATPPSEITLLQRARAALAARPATALRLVQRAARLYPHGALGQEREMIRIQALSGVGRRPEALARARAFLDRHPRSAYAPRLRSLFSELAPR